MKKLSKTKVMKCFATYQQKMILLTFFLISWKMLSIFAVMNLIARHIEYLIRYNDCVIVPGWGAFIANSQSAILNEQNVLLPPLRVVGFNPALTHDDGLLASSVVRKTGVTYDVALKQIAEAVNSLRYQLNQQGEIAISNIGVFVKNADGILFEPFIKTSATIQYLGLPRLNLIPIINQARSEANDGQEATKKDTIYLPIRRSWARVAASIAVVLGLGFVFSTPIVNDSANYASLSAPSISVPEKTIIKLNEPTGDEQLVLNIANIDSTQSMAIVDTISRQRHQRVVAYYKQREERRKARKELMMKRLEEYRIQKELARAQKQAEKLQEKENSIIASQSSNNEVVETSSVRLSQNDNYCLVVASLPSRASAEEYIAKSSNSQLAILEKDGHYRIYAATGESSKAVVKDARKSGLMRKYPKAWVCRK